MIAIVKIAPKEHWCSGCRNEATKYGVDIDKIAGMSVEIFTESLLPNWKGKYGSPCDGRIWQLTMDSTNRLREMMNFSKDNRESWLCEHILEID